MSRVHGFPPVAGPSARRLILGSMPGKASLEAGQYYAHPRNLFWRIAEEVLGVPASLPYDARCSALVDAGVALWDVLRTCTRSSSLDSDIIEDSIVPNDLGSFLDAHPGVTAIYFNGAKAMSVYDRHVHPTLSPPSSTIPRIQLPSTSPANAAIPFDVKLEAWSAVRRDD